MMMLIDFLCPLLSSCACVIGLLKKNRILVVVDSAIRGRGLSIDQSSLLQSLRMAAPAAQPNSSVSSSALQYSRPGLSRLFTQQQPPPLRPSGVSLILDSRDSVWTSPTEAHWEIRLASALHLHPELVYELQVDFFQCKLNGEAAPASTDKVCPFFIVSKTLCLPQIVGPRRLEVLGVASYQPAGEFVEYQRGPYSTLNIRNLDSTPTVDVQLTDRFGKPLPADLFDRSVPVTLGIHLQPTS